MFKHQHTAKLCYFHFDKFVYAVETTGFVGGGECLGEESRINWPLLTEMVHKPRRQTGFVCCSRSCGLLSV